jgi:hypothetical protein
MSVIERRPPAKLSFQIPLPSENTLISIVAVAFLILHILAGSMLLNAPRQLLRYRRKSPDLPPTTSGRAG